MAILYNFYENDYDESNNSSTDRAINMDLSFEATAFATGVVTINGSGVLEHASGALRSVRSTSATTRR